MPRLSASTTLPAKGAKASKAFSYFTSYRLVCRTHLHTDAYYRKTLRYLRRLRKNLFSLPRLKTMPPLPHREKKGQRWCYG
jgi:hypothetical protein